MYYEKTKQNQGKREARGWWKLPQFLGIYNSTKMDPGIGTYFSTCLHIVSSQYYVWYLKKVDFLMLQCLQFSYKYYPLNFYHQYVVIWNKSQKEIGLNMPVNL